MSIAKENFVKTIYQFSLIEDEDCKTGNIAKKLGVSSAAATDMAKKLAEKNLLKYIKYKELKLTKTGKTMALKVIRKHRLWESFLYKIFQMDMHEIHREAEGLEHQTSDFLAEKISSYLGYPEFDPHGDPIPSASGVLPVPKKSISMSTADAGKAYVLSRMISSDKEFFDFCNENGLATGVKLFVVKQFENSKLTEIEIGKRKIILPEDLSKNLLLIKSK